MSKTKELEKYSLEWIENEIDKVEQLYYRQQKLCSDLSEQIAETYYESKKLKAELEHKINGRFILAFEKKDKMMLEIEDEDDNNKIKTVHFQSKNTDSHLNRYTDFKTYRLKLDVIEVKYKLKKLEGEYTIEFSYLSNLNYRIKALYDMRNIIMQDYDFTSN